MDAPGASNGTGISQMTKHSKKRISTLQQVATIVNSRADFTERAELLTKIMRGEVTQSVPHPDFPDVMIEQPLNLNARLKAIDLLARMHGDYVVAEVTLSVDFSAELIRLKQLSNDAAIEGEYNAQNQDETLNFM